MNIFERRQKTKELFLGIFKEEGISKSELESAILQSYIDEGNDYKSFDDIPLEEMEEAVCDTCEAAGLKFNDFNDILDYFYKE